MKDALCGVVMLFKTSKIGKCFWNTVIPFQSSCIYKESFAALPCSDLSDTGSAILVTLYYFRNIGCYLVELDMYPAAFIF